MSFRDEYREKYDIKSKLLLILDMDTLPELEISSVPVVLVPLYVEEMELHAEEVFKVTLRDDWEEEIFYDDAGKPFLIDSNAILYISTNKYKEK